MGAPSIYLSYSRPIDGVNEVALPEPRSFWKRQKELFNWSRSQGNRPLHDYFFDGAEAGEGWCEPSELIAAAEGLRQSAIRGVKKRATLARFVIFIERLIEAAELAANAGVLVRLRADG